MNIDRGEVFHLIDEVEAAKESDVIVVGLAGGTCAGKTTLANNLSADNENSRLRLSQDNYQKGLAYPGRTVEPYRNEHPDNFGLEDAALLLKSLKRGDPSPMPTFDKKRNLRGADRIVEPKPTILWDGIYAIGSRLLRNEVDTALFMDTPFDVRLVRRIRRYAGLLGSLSIGPETTPLPIVRMFTSVYAAECVFGLPQKTSTDYVVQFDPLTLDEEFSTIVDECSPYSKSGKIGSILREHALGGINVNLHVGGFSIESSSQLAYKTQLDPPFVKKILYIFDELSAKNWYL
jgi:uridine kinase